MPHRTITRSGEPVRHPRFGSAPTRSGLSIPEAEIRRGHWRLESCEIYPESVLRANISKQRASDKPRLYYVDILRRCRTCQRPFIFFAEEQRFWFEALKLPVDADCPLCPVCRSASRMVNSRLGRYGRLLVLTEPTIKELEQLVDDATFLLEHGLLNKLTTVGKLKNRAAKRIPRYPGVLALETALRAARDAIRTQSEPGTLPTQSAASPPA